MNNSTQISYEEVRQDAEHVKKCGKTMEIIFEDFTNAMQQVSQDDVFFGQASEALMMKFNDIKKRLHTYTETVDNFSNLILNASDETEATEKSIQADIENI